MICTGHGSRYRGRATCIFSAAVIPARPGLLSPRVSDRDFIWAILLASWLGAPDGILPR